jgi:carbonic anhydrase
MEALFEGNKKWSEKLKNQDPDFFINLAKEQNPEYLWIGCSDSRVPANQLVGMPPGSIFVHRNISNVVVPSDDNLLSVVYYAVKYLKVKRILVVGHYGCGGVGAAISDRSFGILDSWLTSIKWVANKYKKELEPITDQNAKINKLVEFNAIEQARNLAHIPFIQERWKAGEDLHIHPLVYSLEDGKLIDLGISFEKQSDIDPMFVINHF